ncbi:MAG: response regulator [Candidatus Omnitrophica bacterium]|nr:response regulator [Candidatus Omnitrophota bacterium]
MKKILIVDDEEETLIHLSNILKRANYEVISTTKGKEAVDLAIRQRPDLIILDIVLPDMGGSEVATTILGNPATGSIPIVFLTGILTKQEEEGIEGKTGRRYVIAKPITSRELLEMVSKVLAG